MFDPSIIWEQLRAAGMLTRITPVGGALLPFDAGVQRPESLILGEAVQTAEIVIEYVTSEAAGLAPGQQLDFDGISHRVRQPPRRKDDGYFSIAVLEEMP